MTNTIFDVFRVDRLGKRIFSKILFTFALLVGMSVYVCPIGDTDFTQFLVLGSLYIHVCTIIDTCMYN